MDHVEKPFIFGNEVIYIDIIVKDVDIAHIYEDLARVQIVQAYLEVAFDLIDADIPDTPVIDGFRDSESLCQFSDRKSGECVGTKKHNTACFRNAVQLAICFHFIFSFLIPIRVSRGASLWRSLCPVVRRGMNRWFKGCICCLCLPVIAPVDEVDNYVGRYDDQIQEIYDQYIVKSVVIEFG